MFFNFMKIFIIVLFVFSMNVVHAKSVFSKHRFGQQSAVFVTDSNGKEIYAWNENKPLIPASTIKIATGLAALERFGLDFQFRTDFFYTEDTLWVKGYGDPFLTSEELDHVAKNVINQLNMKFLRVSRVVVCLLYTSPSPRDRG